MMTDPRNPAQPDHISDIPQSATPSAEAATFSVTFTGPPARNTLHLDGVGEMTFTEGDIVVEATVLPGDAPPRRIRFMFFHREIAHIGLRDGALVLEVRPASDPAKTFLLTFFVASEEDAQRVMVLLSDPMAPDPQAANAAIGDFYARLRRAPVFTTQALLGANIAVFALMVLAGVSLVNPTEEGLIRWGARYNPLIDQGQWWRLLTPMFVHIGLLHLLFNMWALKTLGDFVERLFGPIRFILVFAGAGLIGNVASTWMHPQGIAAGASGAIFGIMGALVAFIYRRHQAIPRQVLGAVRRSALSFIGYNLLFGFLIPFIDNSAHIGGLIGGLVLGWLLAPPPAEATPGSTVSPGPLRLRIYAVILAVLLTGLIVMAYRATTPSMF